MQRKKGTGNIYYNSGNVGIGTSTTSSDDGSASFAIPDAMFYVKSPTVGGGVCNVVFRGGAAGGDGGSVKLWLASDASHSTYIQGRHDGGGATSLTFGTAPNDSLPTERLRITSTGNVGIGTNNPLNILQVGSGGRLRISNGTSDYTLIGTNETDGTNTRIVISGNVRGGSPGQISYVATSTGSHIFFTTDSTTEMMRITSTGNVGIGTDTIQSSYKLQVQGNTWVQNQLVFNNSYKDGGGADYACNKIALYGAGNTPTTTANNGFGVAAGGVEYFSGLNHMFYTGTTGGTGYGTERLRITSTGIVTIQSNYGVGISEMTAGSLKIGNNNQNYGQVTSASTFNMGCIVLECLDNTEIAVHDAGTANHSLIRYTTNGNITLGRNLAWGTCLIFKGNNGTAWDQTSDHRIKENVKKANLVICYDNVKNINLYRFNYTKAFGNDTHKDRTQLGFIAQQVNLYYPKSITRGKRKLDDNKDVPDLASIDITQVNFTLFGAVKQLIRVVEKQSNRIKRLEEMLNIVADDEVENDADEPYVKIHCEGEVDIDSIVPSEPEENISSSNTSNVF